MRTRRPSPYLGMVLRLGFGMALCVFGGYGLDHVLGTAPWLLVVGVVLGGTLVMLDLFRSSTSEKD